MPTTQTRRPTPAPRPKYPDRSRQVCADAVSEMETIVGVLEDYPDLCEETAALHRQLDRVADACGVSRPEGSSVSLDSLLGDDPRSAARHLISRLPLREVFQNPDLADAFLSELLLALARESSAVNRKERQKLGIANAKAQGVRFGAPKRPLPENFEEMHKAWRDGKLSISEAAAQCGMARTTFYNAVQRTEKSAQETPEEGTTPQCAGGAARRPQTRVQAG